MSLFQKIIDVVQNNQIKGPVFVKEESDAQRQLEVLQSLLPQAEGETKTQIENDIKLLNMGIFGENNIVFELKNSHLPMLVLHDLNLKFEGLGAQIDFLVIMRKETVIVECKNLFGNLEINSNGDFIRILDFNGRTKKEGIYSPITQNTRHLELFRKMFFSGITNPILRKIKEHFVTDSFHSVVVLANPKTVINMKYAKKEVKEQIIRADQLINYLKRLENESVRPALNDQEMYDNAKFYLSYHDSTPKDYTTKYKITPKAIPIEETEIYKALREYRLLKSRELNIKPYFIYNNAQMEEVIKIMPLIPEDLLKISGFDIKRVKDFGNEILEIISRYR
jgi:hypothetical protein